MVPTENLEIQFCLGQRIACDGFLATVKYVGELQSREGSKGVWLGVEWDSAERGKHSGTYGNIKYFETSVPNSGSFIRAKKAETGISCPCAIREKYGKNESTDVNEIAQKVGNRKVEMVGFQKVAKKQSNFQKLKEVVLSTMLVNGPGEQGELAELVPNVTIFDVSCSLLTTWADVSHIVCQLPTLKTLNLSKNRLKIMENAEVESKQFTKLETIILNSMDYSWDDILSCAHMWPAIKQICVCNNKVSALQQPTNHLFNNLKYLDLQGNNIQYWQEVCKLGRLSSLEDLHLDRIELLSIEFLEVPTLEKTDKFPNLKTLSVRHNKLSKWQDVTELNKLRSLRELKISHNPVIYTVDQATARQLVIAKISGIELINRTEVTKTERRGAEIDYLKRFFPDWITNGGSETIKDSRPTSIFLSEHATYIHLVKKHGVPEISEVTQKTAAIKNNLLTLEIFSSLLPENKPLVKKLPVSMPVRRLKALIQRVFNLPSQDIHLFSVNAAACRTYLDNDLRQLSFYSISEGDKVEFLW